VSCLETLNSRTQEGLEVQKEHAVMVVGRLAVFGAAGTQQPWLTAQLLSHFVGHGARVESAIRDITRCACAHNEQSCMLACNTAKAAVLYALPQREQPCQQQQWVERLAGSAVCRQLKKVDAAALPEQYAEALQIAFKRNGQEVSSGRMKMQYLVQRHSDFTASADAKQHS
jgi:hypothetical protein